MYICNAYIRTYTVRGSVGFRARLTIIPRDLTTTTAFHGRPIYMCIHGMRGTVTGGESADKTLLPSSSSRRRVQYIPATYTFKTNTLCASAVCTAGSQRSDDRSVVYNIIILHCTGGKKLIFKTPVAAGLLVESFRIKSALPRVKRAHINSGRPSRVDFVNHFYRSERVRPLLLLRLPLHIAATKHNGRRRRVSLCQTPDG